VTASERRAEDIVLSARAAMADLLAAEPEGIVFGRSATELTFHLSRTISKDWGPSDEVVVTRLDHDANVRPWVIAAEATGATVRWVDFDPATGELAADDIAAAVSARTRLVAVTAGSNLIGTLPNLPRIADMAHAMGALLWVDGVHATAHLSVDMVAAGADFWVCSPYKFLGPHLGVLAARPGLLESLHPAKLVPSTDAVPERFELGTLPYELLAGTRAAVDFLATLGGDDLARDDLARDDLARDDLARDDLARDDLGPARRRERLVASFAALEEHEDALLATMEAGIRALPGVRVYSNAASRTPTLLFTIDGHDSQDIRRALAERGVNAPAGNFYAWECSHHLGLGAGGGVRVGLAPYSSQADVQRLLDGLTSVVAG
jgi:cysteine desulfurase family protein (TIGR01976 family)